MTSEPGSAAMERTEREKLAYRIQGIMSLTLSVEDGEIMGTGQASFQASDMLLATIETLTRERDEAREALKPFAQVGKLIDGPFGPALFVEDDMAFQSGCAWTENGVRKTITWGDFRHACAALAGGKPE